jgi:hypothetical protein
MADMYIFVVAISQVVSLCVGHNATFWFVQYVLALVLPLSFNKLILLKLRNFKLGVIFSSWIIYFKS